MGGAYEFVRRAAANLRETEDSWNPTMGGFAAGAFLGLRCTSLNGHRAIAMESRRC